MESYLRISEFFYGLQGEGRYAGTPCFFVRLSGCTRNCIWCDTKYHAIGKDYSIEDLSKEIEERLPEVIVWTGGEPLLQLFEIKKFMDTRDMSWEQHHIETNGDLLASEKVIPDSLEDFDYVCISPKSLDTAKKIYELGSDFNEWFDFDVKIVTDLETIGKDMVDYATMLMPLTVGDEVKDAIIRKRVWEYCIKAGLNYSPRLHVEVFGSGKRGV